MGESGKERACHRGDAFVPQVLKREVGQVEIDSFHQASRGAYYSFSFSGKGLCGAERTVGGSFVEPADCFDAPQVVECVFSTSIRVHR